MRRTHPTSKVIPRTNQKSRSLSSFVFRLSSFVFRLSSFVFRLSSFVFRLSS
ncbi:MAG: hypothetical protein HFP77_01495, partial [Methylococcales symbiont of Iophon sp. n. MRB-2018]